MSCVSKVEVDISGICECFLDLFGSDGTIVHTVKFDIRIDSSGRYYFIDSNANPSFGPIETENPIAIVLNMYGVSFIEILKRVLLNTIRDARSKDNLLTQEENNK